MPCAFVQGLLYVLWSCDHHTCTGSDVMTSQQDTNITSHTTSSLTRWQLTKVLAAENTRNHVGMCPGDVRCHIYMNMGFHLAHSLREGNKNQRGQHAWGLLLWDILHNVN